jgi:hypothetical protein
LSASLDTINFGGWDGYTEKLSLLILNNNGDQPLDITSVALHGDEFYVDEALPITIPANDQKLMKVVFFPVGGMEGSDFLDILTLNSDRDTTERIAIQVYLTGYYPDITPPEVTLGPAMDTIPNNTVFQISFSEPVRFENDSEITGENVGGAIILKEEDENGPDVNADISVNDEKTVVSVSPLSVLENKNYYLAVKAVLEDYHDNSILKKERTYMATYPEGVYSSPTLQQYRVFPNPATDHLIVENRSNAESCDLVVINMAGQVVSTHPGLKGRLYSLDLSSLDPGFYFLKIYGDPAAKPVIRKIFKK